MAIDSVLDDLKPDRLIHGFAHGVDLLSHHRARIRGIPITAYIPWLGHATSWFWKIDAAVRPFISVDPSGSEAEVYMRYLDECDEVILVNDGDYQKRFFQDRNMAMVDRIMKDGGIVCPIWDGSSGGTANCVRYAERRKAVIRYEKWLTLDVSVIDTGGCMDFVPEHRFISFSGADHCDRCGFFKGARFHQCEQS